MEAVQGNVTREEFDHLVREVQCLKKSLDENTECIRRIESSTEGMVEMFNAFAGGFKVLGWIGRVAKPVAYIAGAVAAIVGAVAALKGGVK